jgi:predicted SnoaL-like aldol condensation-catalyzing enzyme
MISIVASHDSRAQRNHDNVLAFYELMINQRKPAEACEKYLRPDYIQHNPLIPTGAAALGVFFGEVVKGRALFHVKVHRIIACGDWVWAHVNFINLYSDEPGDRGIAGVDIFRIDANGKVAEHWDALQAVPDPATAANTNSMF